MAGNQNSGRKPQSEDIAMIEKLTPLDEIAFQKLKEGIEAGGFQYIKLFFHFRFGKPKQISEVTINQEQPLFSLSDMG